MAKGKSSNPADAFRKAQRAKELKKNKEARKSVRETQTVKRDTRDLESEIRSLKSRPKLAAADKTRLESLESELDYVNKVKEKYVADHPEARDRVFRTHGDKSRRLPGHEDEDDEGAGGGGDKRLYDESGRLRDPTRSVYYDAVYNPFGVPPPGMPYKERTPEPVEESEEEDESDDDDDIVMPEGPPPGSSDEESDDSDDIPLPEGPPPPKLPPIPSGPSNAPFMRPPLHFTGPPGQGMGMGMGMGMGQPFLPFPPAGPGFRPGMHQPGMPFRPPPQMQQQPMGQPGFRPRPPRPPRQPNVPHGKAPVVQDPLSDAPTQTYQGYRMAKADGVAGLPARPGGDSAPGSGGPASPSLPAKPDSNSPAPTPSAAQIAAATISAAPVLRDLRKEATAFVPRGVKRKAAAAPGAAAGVRVNAAPGAGEVDADGDELRRKREDGPGLLGVLQGVFGETGSGTGTGTGTGIGQNTKGGQQSTGSVGKGGSGDDDYQRFLEGLNGLG